MGTRPERRFRRFELRYPVHVKFPSGNSMAEVDVVSKNICHHGLLLESTLPIPYRSPVEFTITLPSLPLKLGGRGEVVRVEEGPSTDSFRIAVACAEPIYEIERIVPK